MRKKKVLVVGGAGYVGGAVTDILAQEPSRYDVRVYDNLLYEDSYLKPVQFVYGDVLDRKHLLPHLKWADVVIWLAAIVGDGACKLDEQLTRTVNQESIAWLARNFKRRIIFTSTCSVYGAQESLVLDEESAVSPLSLYAYTKLESEKLLAKSDAVIFRLGTLYGVSDQFSRIRMDLVVNLMTVRAFSTGAVSVFGGEQYRPLLHVCDAARAIVGAIDYKQQKGVKPLFNLCSENVRILDLVTHLKKHFPRLKVEVTNMPFQDTRNYRVTAQKAKTYLKVHSRYTLDDGIAGMKKLLEEKRIKDFTSARYSNHLFLKDVFRK